MSTHFEIEYRDAADANDPKAWDPVYGDFDYNSTDEFVTVLIKSRPRPKNRPVAYRGHLQALRAAQNLRDAITDGTEFRVVEVLTIRGRVVTEP